MRLAVSLVLRCQRRAAGSRWQPSQVSLRFLVRCALLLLCAAARGDIWDAGTQRTDSETFSAVLLRLRAHNVTADRANGRRRNGGPVTHSHTWRVFIGRIRRRNAEWSDRHWTSAVAPGRGFSAGAPPPGGGRHTHEPAAGTVRRNTRHKEKEGKKKAKMDEEAVLAPHGAGGMLSTSSQTPSRLVSAPRHCSSSAVCFHLLSNEGARKRRADGGGGL
jgi:hypothetical protein